MSSVAVAEVATSSSIGHIPTPVKERIMLWEGGSIAVKIPLEAKRGSFEDNGLKIEFLQFTRHVKKGVVNIFLHGGAELDDFLGRTVVVNAILWQKTFVDGRAFLYVDLGDPQRDVAPSHRMVIMSGKSTDPAAFNTPMPLEGYVLFTSPESKIGFSTSPTPTPKQSATGDTQLDRLLAAGWKIESENAAAVFLYKGQKSLTHHRPKKKK